MDRAAKFDYIILSFLSLGIFLYLMFTAVLPGYGYFIDELYYIACSKRLAFGYVDHPPLSILALALNRKLFGDSVPAIRLLPALATAANVFMTGVIARRLGGNRAAVVIAALAVISMPVFLVMGSFYSMNAFEPLIWTMIVYFVIRLVQEENMKYWLVIGLLTGIGLETKHTMVLYAVALVAGLMITKSRRLLWNRWFFLGLLGCFVLSFPNIVWQFSNGFPSLEFYRNAMINKNVPTGPLNVILGQVLFANPLASLLWILGLMYVFTLLKDGKYRFLGWAFLILLAVMVVSRSSRPDRIGAMYPVVFAAGAIAIGELSRSPVRRTAAGIMMASLVIGFILAAPVCTPLLPPPELKGYLKAIGFSFSVERGKMDEPIPQWLADRIGWKELASDVAGVCHELSPEEQKNAVIVSTNYGEAGALEYYGPEFRLPPVFATHNGFQTWGPPPDSVRTYIAVFVSREDLGRMFESVEEAAVHICGECTQPQRRIPIYVARGPKFVMSREWAKFRIYD